MIFYRICLQHRDGFICPLYVTRHAMLRTLNVCYTAQTVGTVLYCIRVQRVTKRRHFHLAELPAPKYAIKMQTITYQVRPSRLFTLVSIMLTMSEVRRPED